jgi:hypothetical protein
MLRSLGWLPPGCRSCFLGTARFYRKKNLPFASVLNVYQNEKRGMNPPENAVAFGAPGIEPPWTWSEKEDVGIAITPVAAFSSRSVTASLMRFTIQAATQRAVPVTVRMMSSIQPFE